ncbi:L-fucose/L-arabinose isomerase family protein [Christensenella intestinihominis]|uniref:L-fucose/L-arabinose isomerase family protein n=1 Tax=Christensenella intestinihominis TaxID=1851429 RepID=UPI00082FAE51|nr:hypothetical protein [Christensenella intestinihominis]
MEPITFALYFGNRGFFPAEAIADARREMEEAVRKAGFRSISAPADMTRYGAVETAKEGQKYAEFLKQHAGEFDGVIMCLPNFGDENGAMVALKDCGVPILIQAYDDEADRMDPAHRRDAFCGKFAMMDVFYQMKIPFTAYQPHTMNPLTPGFDRQIRDFAAVCRVVKGMKSFKVGAVGARTTAFKTVRFDELTLQKYGIDTETLDLTSVFAQIRSMQKEKERVAQRRAYYAEMADMSGVPGEKQDTIAAIGLVLDEIIEEYSLDALALRCWAEFQQEFGVSPCVPVCDLNERGIAAACEMDVNNAVAMRAIALASEQPASVLDWNNNYGGEADKCIVFHCGPVANSLLAGGKGTVGRHRILENSYGADNCIGVNAGKFDQFHFTFASAKTDEGVLGFYAGEGDFTDDPVSKEFFGTYGVAKVGGLQDVLTYIGENGYKHHVSITKGGCAAILKEALGKYLGYRIDLVTR